MDRRVFIEMLHEERFIVVDRNGANQLIFLDYVNSHDVIEEVEESL